MPDPSEKFEDKNQVFDDKVLALNDEGRTNEQLTGSPTSSSPNTVLRRDLSGSVGDAAAYGLMVGSGETFVPAFVLAVGLGEVFSGLIAAVPVLIGSLLQTVSPWGVRRMGSHRKWVVTCAAIQATCFVPLVVAALIGTIGHLQVMLIASVYWGTSLGTGPAWNTWQATIIPRSIRANFFARRSRLFQATTLFGFLAGGALLQWGKVTNHSLEAFALIFAIAGFSRYASALFLASQSEPYPIPSKMELLPFRAQWKLTTRGPVGRLLVFMVVMQAGVFASGPYFVPYMLKVLHLSYLEYVILIGVSFIAKFLMLPVWGEYAARFGARKLLWLGAIGIVPLAGAWCVSENYLWLMINQIFAGTLWGAYELAIALLFFEAIPQEHRTSILTLYNVLNNLALCIGSLIGAACLVTFGVSGTGYLVAFAASSVMRGLAILLLHRAQTKQVVVANLPLSPISVGPSAGSVDQAVLAALPADDQQLLAQQQAGGGEAVSGDQTRQPDSDSLA